MVSVLHDEMNCMELLLAILWTVGVKGFTNKKIFFLLLSLWNRK